MRLAPPLGADPDIRSSFGCLSHLWLQWRNELATEHETAEFLSMADRRYTEEEVAKIFQQAAEAQQSTRKLTAPADGMTLADLQEIGRDVGIAPELVADAALSLDRPKRSDARKLIGLPIGVGRTIELKRHLSQAEWERLVVDLRETFDARGTVRSEGNFKQWTNGNLQALVEPMPDGDRVRLQTIKGNARAYITGGLGFLAAAAVTTIATAVSGSLSASLDTISILALSGMAMIGIPALQLPAWSRRRKEQMEAVAKRLTLSAPDERQP
jgi:hypothetical protein